MKLLYVCDVDSGGIAEYAIRQFNALHKGGAEVTFLCRSSFHIHRLNGHAVYPSLPTAGERRESRAVRLVRKISDARSIARITVDQALRGNFDGLLIACYAEYFSPFWASIYQVAARKGLIIGTIAHDPVRDFVVGPLWWHRWSVRQGYSFVSHVFVHDDTPVDFGGQKPKHLRVHIIPCGPFESPPPNKTREALRSTYGFVRDDVVFLAFGQIRDGKNLDRFLKVMARLPDNVKLLVAGSGGSASQKSPDHYVKLACQLGINHRCVWDLRYVPEAETGNLFTASDHILLTYSARFHSVSAVLSVAIGCRRTVLASSGLGPLQTAVKKYALGAFVSPDDDDAIFQGATKLVSEPISPDWERYEKGNSWSRNSEEIMRAFSRAS